MTPKKPEWFEMTEDGDSYSGIQKMNKKLPIITLVVAGAVVLGGSIFATANNEPAAVAETPASTQSTTAQSTPTQSTPTQSTPVASSNSQSSVKKPEVKKSGSSSGINALPVPKVTNVPQRGERGERGEGREHEGREGGGERGEGGEHERDDD